LQRLEDEGLIGLRYCTEQGAIEPQANPNGSLRAIAGIYGGPRKNVFGLMPHPERMSEAIVGGVDGLNLFGSLFS
jgi:phosphoribosylformylglycinamidine synthase